MPPADRSSSGLISGLNRLLYKLRRWVRQEIVSDDPWDQKTLFSDSPKQHPDRAKLDAPTLDTPERDTTGGRSQSEDRPASPKS